MLRHLALFVVLFGFWVMLSGQVDYTDVHQRYLLICGLISAGIGTWLARRVGFLYDEGNVGRLALKQIGYLPWLLWQVVLANIDVFKRVWAVNPKRGINPKLVRLPYRTKTDLATVLLANSITLTPGTVTIIVDAEKKEMLIHSLSDAATSGLQAMHDRVLAMEGEEGKTENSEPTGTKAGDDARGV